MKRRFINILGLSAMLFSALSLGSCSSDADSSGLEYMPDMYRSPAIEPYVDYGEIRGREQKELKTRLSALTPPKFTIPYFGTDSTEVKLMLPNLRKANIAFRETHGLFGFDFSLQDEYALAVNDKNLLVLSASNSEKILAKGKELYTAMCQHCHGEKGDGNGPMVTSGAYSGVPNYQNVANLSDGQIYYSIYYGKGMMGAHNSLLSKKEIWTLVHYVRQFQISDYGKFDANGLAIVAAVKDSTNK
jgi:mono/diheme cytochrome c family protein